MGPELSWGQSGRVRTLVPGHTLGPEVVELQGSSPARIRGLCGLCPLGSGCPAPACSPPHLQFTSPLAVFPCCLQSSCLSSPRSSWCPLHLSSFQGPGSTILCQPSSASSQVWNKHKGLGEGLGRGPKVGRGEGRRGVVSVMSGERILRPLLLASL